MFFITIIVVFSFKMPRKKTSTGYQKILKVTNDDFVKNINISGYI